MRPRPRAASEEVRHALQLRGLSRGVSALLRARPLLLDLDFSGTLMCRRGTPGGLAGLPGLDRLRGGAHPARLDGAGLLWGRGRCSDCVLLGKIMLELWA